MRPFYYSTRSPVWNKPFIYEEWRPITNDIVTGAYGNILVSNTSKFFNTETGNYIQPYIRDLKRINRKDVTISIPIIDENGMKKHKTVNCHSIIMKAFFPVEDPALEINHINGDTTDFSVFNLSWCTNRENNMFAYMNSQMKYTDKDGNVVVKTLYSPEQLHKACNMICDGKTYNEISEATGIRYQTLVSIHQGRTYIEYYNQYNLGSVPKPRMATKITEDMIPSIGNDIMNKIPNRVIAKKYGISASTVEAIKGRMLFIEDFKEFDFESVSKPPKEYLTDEQKIIVKNFIDNNRCNYRYPGPLYRDALRSIGFKTSDRLHPALMTYMRKLDNN